MSIKQLRMSPGEGGLDYPAQIYEQPEHAGFRLEGGMPGALLLHGFPGTPVEMLQLGRALHRQGWTVTAPLLPGFGPQIGRLGEHQFQDWQATAEQAFLELRRTCDPVLLVGHSMGGALAVAVAARHPPDRLVLLAPFSGLTFPQRLAAGGVQRLLPPVIRPLRFWKWIDRAWIRAEAANFVPGLAWDDPALRAALQQFRFPMRVLTQVQQAGLEARRLAPEISVPTLVIQGTLDLVVWPNTTRRLITRLAHPPRYLEVTAGHTLLFTNHRSWTQVERTVLAFSAELLKEKGGG